MDVTHLNLNSESLLTSHQAGAILQVNPSSIVNWVRGGLIPAFRTPGGHRRIRAGDLVHFLSMHQMPVPGLLARAARRRVLLVDDDKAQLVTLERLFKQFSRYIDITTADNGIEALVKVGAVKPHMIVLDVFMPYVDGVEVCNRLHAHPDTQAMKIVVASGQMTPEIESKALAAGAYKIMAKPVDVPSLVIDLGLRDILEASA